MGAWHRNCWSLRSVMEIGVALSRCAESVVCECLFFGQPAIYKHRIAKTYRHPDLDKKLREQRTVREARALLRCKKLGVPAPDVFNVDREQCAITMQRIRGVTARDFINQCPAGSSVSARVLERIGSIVAQLHEGDQIHGDLTTSNFMVRDAEDIAGSLTVIDFGLVRESTNAEERAVDLYVLERAIQSSHPLLHDPFQHVWRGYCSGPLSAGKLKLSGDRLEKVRARGRKRSMIG